MIKFIPLGKYVAQLLTLIFCNFCLISFGQSASASWDLTSNGSATIAGNVSATNITSGVGFRSGGISAMTFDANGVSSVNWIDFAASSFDISSANYNQDYYEYSVAPIAGNDLTVNAISFEASAIPSSFATMLYYSLDNFATSSAIGSFNSFSNSGLNIIVPDGSTLSIRIFGMELQSASASFFNKNVVISGVTSQVCVTPIIPLFQQIYGGCVGNLNLSPLPNQSINGISGSWQPPMNNMATTTYTFTPNSGQCASTTTMTIAVSPIITPTFNPFLCSTSTGFPIVSNEGIYGTISPALALPLVVGNTYTYSFTPDAGQCATYVNPTVTVIAPITPTFTQVGPICAGVSMSPLPSQSNNGINGHWTPALNNTATTTYTFNPSYGQCGLSTTMTIVVNSLPSIPLISANGSLTFCDGVNVVLTSSEATGNLWSNGETSQSITVNTSGDYQVSYTDLNSCSSTSLPLTVVVNPNPIPVISSNGPLTFCSGENVFLSSSESTGNLWSTGETTQSITVNTSGDYFVTVSNLNGCSANSLPTTVTVNPNPAIPIISANGSLTFCDGGNVVLTSSELSDNLWSNASATQSISVNSSGDYIVEYTDANGCTATSLPTTVTVNPNPTIPTITPNGSLTFCDGGNVVLTSSESTGNSWSNGASTQSITVNSTGNYSVTCTDALGCSATSLPVTVTVNPMITPTFAAVSPICSGATLSSLPSISLNGISGTWNPALDNTQTTTYSFIPFPGQCANMGTLTVIVNPNPAIPIISESGSLTFCEGGNIVLTSSEPTGNLWSTGETTQSITVNTSGDYFVTVSNLNGCSANSLPTTVTVNLNPTIPTITANGPLTFCDGGNVVLTSSESNGNLWSNGASTQSITVNSTGNYSLTFTDALGCSATSVLIQIIVNSVPIANVSMLTIDTITAFPSGQNYQWINCANDLPIFGASDINYGVEVNGDYAVIVTNSSGCMDTSSCISVDLPFLDPDAGLVIFPNPTTGNFSVSINTDQFVDVIQISFLNSTGNVISTQTTQAASGVQIINFANNQLQAGLYLIVVSDQNGNQLSGNILIQ